LTDNPGGRPFYQRNNNKLFSAVARDIVELQKIDRDFTICQAGGLNHIDFTREFVFLSKTDDEISLVCESEYVPSDAVTADPGWKALKICGRLDLEMTGVISKIAGLLAEAGLGIFVVSTYNTDYILLKAANFDRGLQTLARNGYIIIGNAD